MLTVAIPTLGRAGSVLDALRSITEQVSSEPFEVLVLDNACDPDLANSVRAIAGSARVPVAYVPVPCVGLHNGRHEAARRARGDVLVYVDDDILAEPGWLAAFERTFRDPEIHLAGGPCLPMYEADVPPWLDQFFTRREDGTWWCGYLTIADLGPDQRDVDPRLIWGANFAMRKSTLYKAGGFHPDALPWSLRRFRGDGESAVSDALGRLGLRAAYSPDAIVHHRVPADRLTMEYLERRAFLQGISDSFSAARAPEQQTKDRAPRSPAGALRPRRLAGQIKRRLLRPRAAGERPIGWPRLEEARRAGFAYHQHQLRTDRAVQAWVRRPDYWDAAVPGTEGDG
jgi:glycosyltransferase involved in cell wall biosynthesis